ncbi:MAG: AraC family transcriptional regulator [Woeseiaceae bacterium]|nr:AraC family transcriptional regulator [Woeseiaceae bacterium]
MNRILITLLTGLLVTGAGTVVAEDSAETGFEEAQRQQFRSLDEDVQSLKKEVLDLNRDLFLLEEELLFPANSQVAFFISMDVGEYFDLDSVSLKIDGKEVTNYLYTEREADALVRGGVHRVHMANLKTGDHELIATFVGKGPNVRDYRRGATLTFDKGIGAKYIELEITDREKKQQPEFVIKEWE